MDRILKKIYSLKNLDHSDIKAVKKYFAALNFIMVEDDYRKIPNTLLTSKGFVTLVNSYENEKEKRSEITGNYPFSRKNSYDWSFFMTKESYEVYRNSIVTYLLSNKKLLVNYLNERYNENFTIDDLTINGILKNIEVINKNKIINNKRNLYENKKDKFIRTDYGTILVRENKLYLLRRDKNERNVSKREYRGNSLYNKNERDIRYATTT